MSRKGRHVYTLNLGPEVGDMLEWMARVNGYGREPGEVEIFASMTLRDALERLVKEYEAEKTAAQNPTTGKDDGIPF